MRKRLTEEGVLVRATALSNAVLDEIKAAVRAGVPQETAIHAAIFAARKCQRHLGLDALRFGMLPTDDEIRLWPPD